MTYSVSLFKDAISGVNRTTTAWKNAGVLLAILFVIMTITILFSRVARAQETRETNLILE